jgi:hypothetical protein
MSIMSYGKRSIHRSKAKAVKKIGRRQRKCYFRRFKNKHYRELKEALSDKRHVVRVFWELNYLNIEYSNREREIIYGNFCQVERLLRCRLFYNSGNCTLVNLYFFNQVRIDERGNTVLFSAELKQKKEKHYKIAPSHEEMLHNKDKKQLTQVTSYLLGDQWLRDVKRLYN